MRKKISVQELEVGMYLQEVSGSWIKNPFWRSRFMVSDAQQIATIKASGIREVWIDTGKGRDIDAPVLSSTAAQALPIPSGRLPRSRGAVPITEELARAADVCAQSKEAVTSMFREARMGNVIDLQGVGAVVQQISDSLARNHRALISLARLKTADDYTYMHSVAVCAMMAALARQLGLPEAEVRAAGIAGLLHDMGKALLPLEVLNKPGKLTPAEFAIVRSHPERGHRLLSMGGKVDAMALDVCLHHHEKMDGSGYPKGLKDAQISLHAKMGAVCDVYDAITSNRPYKNGWDPAESMRMMGQWAADGHFDTAVFQAFVRSMGIYPVGSLVRLQSGRIGVVVDQAPASPTAPVVKVFFDSNTLQRIGPHTVDLSDAACAEKIIAREDPVKWNFADLNELWSGLPGRDP